ncbi:MAG: BMP family ABC transporter substrate-binding protein [Oscillospiraceae bacterium]
MKKIISLILCISIILLTTACSSKKSVALVIQSDDIIQGSFGELIWMGIVSLQNEINPKFIKKAAGDSIETKLQKAVKEGNNIIWVLEETSNANIKKVATANPKQKFAVLDYQVPLPNVVSLTFKAEEGSALAGYIAGYMTKTNKIGFIGGRDTDVINKFEEGFLFGIKTAAKELDKEIEFVGKYSESFYDEEIGKAMADEMYADGTDIIYQAAGLCGNGVITSAVENNKWVIGADYDQSSLAEYNVLTSVMKNVTIAVNQVTIKMLEETLTSNDVCLGLKENAISLAPTRTHIPDSVWEKAMAFKQIIIDEYQAELDD